VTTGRIRNQRNAGCRTMPGNHPKAFTGGRDKTQYETFQTSSSE